MVQMEFGFVTRIWVVLLGATTDKLCLKSRRSPEYGNYRILRHFREVLPMLDNFMNPNIGELVM